MSGNKRSDLLNAPFDLSELVDTSNLIIEDAPLPLNKSQSPLQAAARKLLAELTHLTTNRSANGELQGVPGPKELDQWRRVFAQETLGDASLLSDIISDEQITLINAGLISAQDGSSIEDIDIDSDQLITLGTYQQLLSLTQEDPIVSFSGQGGSTSIRETFESLEESKIELVALTLNRTPKNSQVQFDLNKVIQSAFADPHDPILKNQPDKLLRQNAHFIEDEGHSLFNVAGIESVFYKKNNNIFSLPNLYSEIWSNTSSNGATFASIWAPNSFGWTSKNKGIWRPTAEQYFMTKISQYKDPSEIASVPAIADYSSIDYELSYFNSLNAVDISNALASGSIADPLRPDVGAPNDNGDGAAQIQVIEGGLPFVVSQRDLNDQIIDERIAWLSGDGVYNDPFTGLAASIEFTPLFATYPAHSSEAALLFEHTTPRPPADSGIVFQIDSITYNESENIDNRHILNLKTLKSQGDSQLIFTAFDGEVYSNSVLGHASFLAYGNDEISNGNHLLAQATNIPEQDQPFLSLSNYQGSQFSLSSLKFSSLSRGAFDAIVSYGDGSAATLKLDFGDTDQSPEMSSFLRQALQGPITRIDFVATADSETGLLNHKIGFSDIEVNYSIASEPLSFDLAADLTKASISNIADLGDAQINLKKAILRGLTTESIQIKELSELIDNRIINFDSWSIAQLALIGRQLNSKNGQNKFSAIELAELLRRDLVLTPKDIGLIDNIYSFDEQIELLVKPVESPLEVLRNRPLWHQHHHRCSIKMKTSWLTRSSSWLRVHCSPMRRLLLSATSISEVLSRIFISAVNAPAWLLTTRCLLFRACLDQRLLPAAHCLHWRW